jgi:hypothetical protein
MISYILSVLQWCIGLICLLGRNTRRNGGELAILSAGKGFRNI